MKNLKKNSGSGVKNSVIKAEFNNSINDLTTEALYQWDSYQTLCITGIDFVGAPRVHFANKKSTEALVVQGQSQTDGSVNFSIPNTLLQEKYNIVAYVYTNTGLTSKTIKSITIPLIPRLKPSEYVDITNEDIVEIEALELQAKIIIDGLTASEYDATESYKRPNIVYKNYSSYMCLSDSEITGVDPSTNPDKWQKLANGINITGISIDKTTGKLVFTLDSGETYNVNFQTIDADLVEAVPNATNATNATNAVEAKKSKYAKTLIDTEASFPRDITYTKNSISYTDTIVQVACPGLYVLTVQTGIEGYYEYSTCIISVENLTKIYSSAPYAVSMNGDNITEMGLVNYIPTTGDNGFSQYFIATKGKITGAIRISRYDTHWSDIQ